MHSPPSQAPWNRVDAGQVKKSVLLSSQSSRRSAPGRATCWRKMDKNSSRWVISGLRAVRLVGDGDLVHLLQDALQRAQFLGAEGNALAHPGAVRGPVADIILGLAVVPADEVEPALPSSGPLGQDRDLLDDIVFDFCHDDITCFL